jgi:hypothetical protein
MAILDVIIMGSTPTRNQLAQSTQPDMRLSDSLDLLISLHRMGVDVRWALNLSENPHADWIQDEFHRAMIPQSMIIPYRDHWSAVFLPTARLVYFPFLNYGGIFNLFCFFTKTRGMGIAMTCDHSGVHLDGCREAKKALQQVDLFFTTPAEARQLTSVDDLDVSIRMLAELGPEVVISDGDQGSYGFADDQLVHESAIPLIKASRTNSSGYFHAGFIKAWLDGKDLSTCLQWGNIMSGMSFADAEHPDSEISIQNVEKILRSNGSFKDTMR